MGQEITHDHFTEDERQQFHRRLAEETRLLREHFGAGGFDDRASVAGFEIEGWLIDSGCRPTPMNERFLELLANPLATPELARFNIELNVEPLVLADDVFSRFEQRLQQLIDESRKAARKIDAELLLTGILPTLRPEDCSLENMSGMKRYVALNEEVAKARGNRPIELKIEGVEALHLRDSSVMLESATTSLQLHLQVPALDAHHYYNASIIASAPLLAVGVNSPFLFERQLWQETRIAVFEQTVDTGASVQRVSFGSGYAEHSIVECFEENLEHYPVLLPEVMDTSPEQYAHLRLHNGSIWRWNRPLIGFDSDACPHFRIEQRVLPAGPTIQDMMANAAFYYGLVAALKPLLEKGERMPFEIAKDNFYRAAKDGLSARLDWNGKSLTAAELVLDELLPIARDGLESLQIDTDDADFYLSIVEARARSGRTGAQWQIEQVKEHGANMAELACDYLSFQKIGLPVHNWKTKKKTNMPELNQIYEVPDALLELENVSDIHTVFSAPTLLHLQGRRPNPLFVSVLLHGNEDTGFLAIQRLLKKYRSQPLPRSLSIFFGNIEAAKKGMRRLDGQPDYNRVWPGTELPESDETRLMQQVVGSIASRKPFASIDMHNNTGKNPHYGCINFLDNRFQQLASLFSHIVVYFQTPKGVQSMAMAQYCPAVTVECGKPHLPHGVEHAFDYLDTVLHLEEIPNKAVPPHDIDIFHTVARVMVSAELTIGFGKDKADIVFREDLDSLNFSELSIGTPFARIREGITKPLLVLDENGEDVSAAYFAVVENEVVLTQAVMPSMLTLKEKIIRQDCLCYLMERVDIDEVAELAPF